MTEQERLIAFGIAARQIRDQLRFCLRRIGEIRSEGDNRAQRAYMDGQEQAFRVALDLFALATTEIEHKEAELGL